MTVALVPFEGAHFSTLRSWFESAEEVVLWGGADLPYPLEEVHLAAMLAEAAATPPARRCWSALVDGEVVGHAQLAYDWRNGLARLARVAIAPHLRGKGHAASMLRRVIDEAFEHPAIERVELNVFSHNARAIELYRRLGFRDEGNRRRAAKVGEARWDMLIMGLLRDEARGPRSPDGR
jgi:RimJ/RimL family protein N-acetyltransferase